MKCKNCDKPLKQSPGKRAKEYCDSTCRSNHWQKEKRKETVRDIVSTPYDKVRPVEKKIKDLTQPKVIKPVVQKKTNFVINTARIAEIELLLPSKYLSKRKRKDLIAELAELKKL